MKYFNSGIRKITFLNLRKFHKAIILFQGRQNNKTSQTNN